MRSGQIVKAESLIRWERDDEVLLPGAFLDVAQDCGLMVEIGELTLAHLLTILRQTRARDPHFSIAVNMSIEEVMQPDLAEKLARRLEVAALPPSSLTIEITETSYSDPMENDSGHLQRLADAGFKFALDDFGTGWSIPQRARGSPIRRHDEYWRARTDRILWGSRRLSPGLLMADLTNVRLGHSEVSGEHSNRLTIGVSASDLCHLELCELGARM